MGEPGLMAGRKKVVVVGGTGLIGSGVVTALDDRYEVIRASRSGGDVMVDATSSASVEAMFKMVGPYDALMSLFGSGKTGSFLTLSDEDMEDSFRSKALAQIRLVRLGVSTMRDGGSFTLSSGILSQEPHAGFSAIATVNGAVDAFCRGASVELPRHIRINCVTPVFMKESLARVGVTETDYPTLSIADTAQGYLRCLEGDFTGHVIDARKPVADRGAG
jgi:NAD(P)-dependent dehydrogenase (short-subunit alcohol dehydrogenase family)